MCVAVSSWSCIQYFYSALEQTEEKRRLKTMEIKSINLFYRSNLLCFYLTSFFCKIDLGLDTISFLERLLKVCDSQNSQFLILHLLYCIFYIIVSECEQTFYYIYFETYTDTKVNGLFLAPARMSVIKLILARNTISFCGLNKLFAIARSSPGIFVNLYCVPTRRP